MDFNFSFDVNDHEAVTPVEMALNPGLMNALEDISVPGWPDSLPGTPFC